MADLDQVWQTARRDLIILTESGDEDPFLWEHASRVATCAAALADLESIRSRRPDRSAAVAAALYHDAGWVVRLQAGEVQRSEILLRPLPEMHREQSAAHLEASLSGLLPAETLGRGIDAILTMGQRSGCSLEACIVSDADNLDDFGPLALWPVIRRGVLDGKGIQSVIDTWRRRTEYQFWTVRLSDSFFLKEARQLAAERFTEFDRVMKAIERHQASNDVNFSQAFDDAESKIMGNPSA